MEGCFALTNKKVNLALLREISMHNFQLTVGTTWAVVVVQLAERSLPIPEIRGSKSEH